MAENVYIIPPGNLSTALYGDQFRVASESAADGELIGANEIAARVSFRVSGKIIRENFAAFRAFRDRMRGGLGLAGLIDFEMRLMFGWDLVPAINSSGDEFWIIGGGTSAYAGESAGATWRSINALAAGGEPVGETSIAVDGLLAGEVIPAGCTARFGDWRHVVTTAATANGSGEATLTISSGLREALADNASVRVPGDFALARMIPGSLSMGETGPNAITDFSAAFREVYSDEIAAGIGSYVLP